jgi:hypothetical protein
MDFQEEKKDIEQEISRARDGVGDHIDELDRRLRATLDVGSFAREHAPQLIAGGAVVGFLAGFGFPRPLRKLIGLSIPLAIVAMKIKSARNGVDAVDDEI